MVQTPAKPMPVAERNRKWVIRASLSTTLLHAILILFFIVFVFPFYWMITSALKPLGDIYLTPVPMFPPNITFQPLLEVLGIVPSSVLQSRGGVTLTRTMLNSTIIAITYTLGSVFLSSLSGYTFAKVRFKGRNILFISMLVTMMIPGSVGLIPNYMIMSSLKWINTWWPLIIPGLATPFSVFWMRQYITTVPDEMIEAAQIDGAGPFGIYWRVVMPVILPGIAALAIFNFMANWNSLIAPLIYLSDHNLYTFPLFLSLLNFNVQGKPSPLNMVFAASFISILPILALYLLAQRYFITGLTAGTLK